MAKKQIITGLLITASIILSGCASDKATPSEHADPIHHAENGDLRERTLSINTLPTFLDKKPEDMKTIYAAAAQHRNLLEFIPCYCGCADSANHKDNYDCFVSDIEGEEVVWDDHGTRCGVCLETAAESIIQYQEGKSLRDIRDYIDSKYKEGYAKPTPTPMPGA